MAESMSLADKEAEFLLVRLAEQGRPVETIAQFIASYIVAASDALDDNATHAFNLLWQVFARVESLMDDQRSIWENLLSGGNYTPPFEIVSRFSAEPKRDIMLIAKTNSGKWVATDFATGDLLIWDTGFFQMLKEESTSEVRPGSVISVLEDDIMVSWKEIQDELRASA